PSPIRATGGHPPVRPALVPVVGPAVLCWVWLVFNCVGRIHRRYLFGGPLTGPHTRTLPGDVAPAEPTRRACSGRCGDPDTRGQHRIDQAVVDGLLRGQDLVALDVAAHFFLVLARGVGDHPLQQLAHPDDLVRLDLEVGDLAPGPLGVGL